MAQSTMDHSAVMLVNTTMMNPTNTTIELNANFEMSSPGMFTAKVDETYVNVSSKGVTFGYMIMPELEVDSSQIYINVTSLLHVTDVEAFTEATASVLQGHPSPWEIVGHPGVNVKMLGSNLHMKVKMDKHFDLPKTLFIQMQAQNMSIQHTTATTLTSSATSSFFSSSVLEMKDIGVLVFNVTDLNDNYLGEVTIDDFRAVRDFNIMHGTSMELIALDDGSNVEAIHKTLQTFANGVDQNVNMIGPIRSRAPFLSNVVNQEVKLVGAKVMDSMQVKEMHITNTTADFVNGTAVASFFSDLPISIKALGQAITCELYNDNNVKIGETVLDRDVVAGYNEFSTSASLFAKTDGQKAAVHAFLSNFSAGIQQTIRAKGPVGHPNPFVNNMLDSPVRVYGALAISDASAGNFAIKSTNATHMTTSSTITFVSFLPMRMAALGGPCLFELTTDKGELLGHTLMTQDVVVGLNTIVDSPTWLSLDANGTNAQAIKNFLYVMGQGDSQKIAMRGPINSSPLLNNMISQVVSVAGSVLLANVQSGGTVIVDATETTLTAQTVTSFTTNTEVLKGGMGTVSTFNLTDTNGVFLAKVSMDSAINVGLNTLPSTSVLYKTSDNTAALQAFNSKFMSGETQKLLLKGPVDTVAPFLEGIISVEAEMAGLNVSMVKFAIITEDSMKGYKAEGQTLRGPIMTGENPFPVPMRMSGLSMDVDMIEPIEFSFHHTLLGKHSCPRSNMLTRQLTIKGMYKDNVSKDYVDLTPADTTTFFSPAVPQPGQASGEICKALGVISIGLPCCFFAAPIAAACRAEQRGDDYLKLKARGNMTIAVNNKFTQTVSYVQKEAPLLFSPSIVKGFLLDLEMNCDNFDSIK